MFTLEFKLDDDYSGCRYLLFKDNIFVKSWSILYGYNTPAWQEQEKQDIEKMKKELHEMGLDFDKFQKPL